MQYCLADDGTKLAYKDEGHGLPVLALAGLTRDMRDFDYLAPFLGDVRLIRLDSRGRGASQWSGPATYTVPQEARDVLTLLDHLRLPRVAIIGSSRGGLIGLFLAATAKDRLAGLCLNDVGPVLDHAALKRISGYIGAKPGAKTLTEMASRLQSAIPGFDGVSPQRWFEEATRHYVQTEAGLDLPYDPDLRISFEQALAGPDVDLWPLFDACEGLPIALLRGRNSDLLTKTTATAMLERRPDMLFADVPDRGHIPFLDEPESLAIIREWIDMLGRGNPLQPSP